MLIIHYGRAITTITICWVIIIRSQHLVLPILAPFPVSEDGVEDDSELKDEGKETGTDGTVRMGCLAEGVNVFIIEDLRLDELSQVLSFCKSLKEAYVLKTFGIISEVRCIGGSRERFRNYCSCSCRDTRLRAESLRNNGNWEWRSTGIASNQRLK